MNENILNKLMRSKLINTSGGYRTDDADINHYLMLDNADMYDCPTHLLPNMLSTTALLALSGKYITRYTVCHQGILCEYSDDHKSKDLILLSQDADTIKYNASLIAISIIHNMQTGLLIDGVVRKPNADILNKVIVSLNNGVDIVSVAKSAIQQVVACSDKVSIYSLRRTIDNLTTYSTALIDNNVRYIDELYSSNVPTNINTSKTKMAKYLNLLQREHLPLLSKNDLLSSDKVDESIKSEVHAIFGDTPIVTHNEQVHRWHSIVDQALNNPDPQIRQLVFSNPLLTYPLHCGMSTKQVNSIYNAKTASYIADTLNSSLSGTKDMGLNNVIKVLDSAYTHKGE